MAQVRRNQLRGLGAAALLGAALGCQHDAATATRVAAPVRFQMSNALVAPVTVMVDGTPLVILGFGRSSALTVPASAHLLTWTAAKPTDADGRPIPDDIGEVQIRVSNIGAALEIDNLVEGRPHFTASIINQTTAQVAVGVFDGATVACAGILPAARPDLLGFVQLGYYRLGTRTEVRAYRSGTSCTGPYVAWPQSQVTSLTAKAGLIRLSLDAVP